MRLLALSDERDLIRAVMEDAGGGHHLIVVHAADPMVVERVRRVLVTHRARHLLRWERFTLTELSDKETGG